MVRNLSRYVDLMTTLAQLDMTSRSGLENETSDGRRDPKQCLQASVVMQKWTMVASKRKLM
jgi:hypothetical protein